MSAVANGLFGPGIFGTGIDLSALDSETALRLGQFFGEQIRAAGDAGYARGLRDAGRLARERADALSAADLPNDAWGARLVIGDIQHAIAATIRDRDTP